MLYVDDIQHDGPITDINAFDGRKPEGVAVELADFVMRLLDYAAHKGIWLEYCAPESRKQPELYCVVNYLHSRVSKLKIDTQTLNLRKIRIQSIVRIVQGWLKFSGYDLFDIIRLKMEYNKNRPHRHGMKY